MLLPADVLSLKCEFVKQTVKFLRRRESEVELCYHPLLKYFADAQLASMLYDADCLDTEDICRLEKKADKYGAQPELNPGTVVCADQVDINLAKTLVECASTVEVVNGSGLAFPTIVLYNDSLYHDAILDVKVTDCLSGSVQTEQIRVGCSGDPESCNDDHRVSGYMTFLLTNPTSAYPGGYIQTLRLYATDANGLLVNSALDLDVSPSNVAAWNGCGSCVAVNGADLYFSSGNYKVAWKQLMENVSQTLFGGDYIEPDLIQGASQWLYTFRIKHNPAGIWMGPNKNNFIVLVYNGSTFVPATTTTQALPQGSFLHQELDFDVACGEITVTADSFAGSAATPSANTNFNFLQFLTADITSLPISVSYAGDSPCTLAKLVATYSSPYTVDSLEWLDPLDNSLGSSTTIYVNSSDSGTYTFQVTLENGCIVSDTITV